MPVFQLSDDSDIEGHPNVDKKSLIRSGDFFDFVTIIFDYVIADGSRETFTRNVKRAKCALRNCRQIWLATMS